MSRALRNAVLAVLFLVSACLAGEPGAPFDAAAKDAFGPGQRRPCSRSTAARATRSAAAACTTPSCRALPR
ncbi:MAG: hypothetical protein M0D55_14590 [Elusimicrobiota bacterium]|nr:MAG: hypothetical protein M0D55_14590 [Elusimicrobiota bacterium]